MRFASHAVTPEAAAPAETAPGTTAELAGSSDTVSPQPRKSTFATRYGRNPNARGNIRTWILGGVGVLGFLLLWEFFARTGILLRGSLPPAGDTLAQSARLLTNSAFLGNVGDTLWATAVGFGIAFVIAVPAGLVLGMSQRVYLLTSTVVELLRPLPPIAFVPLMVLVVGQDLRMKAIIVMLGCLWPLLTNTIHGVHATNATAVETGRSFGWNRLQVAWRIIWPSAVPSILTGVRITVSIALILCIGAEYIGGSSTGIGSWLLQQSMLPQGMQAVCAGVVITGLLGLLINGVVNVLENKFAKWTNQGEAA